MDNLIRLYHVRLMWNNFTYDDSESARHISRNVMKLNGHYDDSKKEFRILLFLDQTGF